MRYNIAYMQPHSMCAVALAGYVWKNYSIMKVAKANKEAIKLSSAEMQVEYRTPDGLFRMLGYKISDISVKADTEIKFNVAKSHGSLHCTIEINRASESSEVRLDHSEQHASGLKELFNVYDKSIVGRHINSLKYNTFDGTFENDYKRLRLSSDVLRGRGTPNSTFVRSQYTLDITRWPELI